MKAVLSAILLLLSSVAAEASCLDTLAAHRAQTEADYLKSDDSPFDQALRARFAGFAYFAGDAAYCVDASFAPAAGEKQFDMAAFNGKSIPFRKYGVFRFKLGGAERSLTAYQRMDLPPEERTSVLIPFQDRSNGHGTYGGGRYLELELPIGAHTTLDFNRAFNPLCAYDAKFTCPMPPPENRLTIAVSAGEKAYAGTH
ncbi:MAG TPA: DUF1684 domain-containing protein [Steroidobacteraceae bacterium]